MEQWLKKVPQRHGYYIAGFVDGEGSFNVSLKKREDYRNPWKISASFNVSQRDRVILAFIKRWMRSGTLRERRDGVVYYEVTNVSSLYHNVTPFFTRFPFLSATKKRNFSIFKEVVEKMYRGEHLTPIGFKNIISLRERLNVGRGRKRKYNRSDVISEQ